MEWNTEKNHKVYPAGATLYFRRHPTDQADHGELPLVDGLVEGMINGDPIINPETDEGYVPVYVRTDTGDDKCIYVATSNIMKVEYDAKLRRKPKLME